MAKRKYRKDDNYCGSISLRLPLDVLNIIETEKNKWANGGNRSMTVEWIVREWAHMKKAARRMEE